jgi:hypothetical protein
MCEVDHSVNRGETLCTIVHLVTIPTKTINILGNRSCGLWANTDALVRIKITANQIWQRRRDEGEENCR